MKNFGLCLMALSLAGLTTAAFADNIPYNHVGHVAPTTPIKATGNTLDIYFYGSSAADDDYVKLEDVTQGWTSAPFDYNHSTTVGQETIFSVNPGDVLVFLLVNQATSQTFSSDPHDSDDDYNHAYVTPYTDTGLTAIAGIPPGTFVGFEDLYIGANSDGVCGGDRNQSDCDYNDDEIVFVDATTNPVPEPSSLALLGTSILGAAGVVRRRFANR